MYSGEILTGDVVRLLPEFYTCPFCYAGTSTVKMQGSGVYKLYGSLSKHLKHHHPAAKTQWGYSDCPFTGKGCYPIKSMRDHFEKHHSGRQSKVRVVATMASPVTKTDTAETVTVTTTTTTGMTTTAGPSSRSPAIEKRFNDSIMESFASEDSFRAEDFALDRHNDDGHYDSRGTTSTGGVNSRTTRASEMPSTTSSPPTPPISITTSEERDLATYRSNPPGSSPSRYAPSRPELPGVIKNTQPRPSNSGNAQ